MKSFSPVTFGTDIELMIFNTTNKTPHSALDILPGTKEDPCAIPSGEAMQADNVNAEMNTLPVTSFDEFNESWTRILQATNQQICMTTSNPDIRMHALPSFIFPNVALQHPRSKVFGCDPDFDAHTRKVNRISRRGIDPNLRSAGGHVHIGANSEGHEALLTPAGKIRAAILMDLFVGLPMTVLEDAPGANDRRKLYGKPSAHRPKIYGVEYRSLSNTWSRTPRLAKLCFMLTQSAMNYLCTVDGHNDSLVPSLADQIDYPGAREAITNGDKYEAMCFFGDWVAPLVDTNTMDVYTSLVESSPLKLTLEDLSQLDVEKCWQG